jgi:hypothetical protein
MELYNQHWTRREVEARVGRLEQVGGLRRYRLCEGLEDGVEQILVRTGAGLAYQVTPSRCLDISLAEFAGVPLSWQGPNGDVHPAYYEANGLEWLRTAAGGLLMTCGFTQAGAPSVDQGEQLPLHGRAHHLPARQVVAEGRWFGDEYAMSIRGIIEEARIFGDNVRLTREIRSVLGSNRLTISDHFENLGFTPAPLMLLYHFNFGFPLLMEGSRFKFPSTKVTARDDETPMEGYDRWQAPDIGHRERVYIHEELKTDANGWAEASVLNPHFPLPEGLGTCSLELTLSWSTANLPAHVQWRMAGAGTHVLGIEPTNCNVRGRAAAREDGSLVMLEPGESKSYEMALDVALSQ